MIRVAVNGASGKMGREVVKAVSSQTDLILVGACDIKNVGKDAGEVAGIGAIGVLIDKDLEKMLDEKKPDVVVDFTSPHSVYENTLKILEKAHAVIGTTGLTDDQIEAIRNKTALTGKNAAICPNFAIGAILMIHFAKIAIRYFPNVEIIELHHDQKVDAPSGTAITTAKLLSELRPVEESHSPRESKELFEGSRGADIGGIRVHSVRLPGFVAHQEVIFGGLGQTLTIRHDSTDRSSFMPGVLLAIRQVVERRGLTYGLESMLDI
ncbi:MAG: 4-hydroxy-tetrahydrodipicolinate reductase [Actinobacteria bacterium]|nr:4-hydroxy-tetrahydrodipicolinate reductase [Actinomycetota bacterium]